MPILDSSFIIDVLRGRTPAIDMLGQAVVEKRNIGISTITLMEIQSGLALRGANRGDLLRAANDLSYLQIYDVDEEIAKTAGTLRADSLTSGRVLGSLDAIIAATAICHGQELWTADNGFKARENLKVRFYR